MMMTRPLRAALPCGAVASRRLSLGRLALIGLLAAFASQVAAAQENASNAVTWQNVFRLPDGRLFVTDGAMMLDASLVEADQRPSAELNLSTQVLEGYLAADHPDEFTLRQLDTGSLPQTYGSPSGVFLRAKYVDYLRMALPARSLRLRMKGARDPVVIVSDGVAVGVVMPVAPPRG